MPYSDIGISIGQVSHRVGHVDFEINVRVLLDELMDVRHQKMDCKAIWDSQTNITFEPQIFSQKF